MHEPCQRATGYSSITIILHSPNPKGALHLVFDSLRKRFKWLIVVIAVAFALGLLYVGVPFFGAGTTSAAVIATVNGSNVSYEEHQAAFQSLAYQYQTYYGPLSASDEELLRYQALEMVLNQKLALDAARKEGISVARSEIDEALEAQKSMFPSDADYRDALRSAGMTENDLRDLLEQDLLLEKVIDSRYDQVEVSEQEIAAAYEAVNARHILIQPEMVDGEQDWDGALAKAQDILGQLQNGADFAVLAAAHSADGSAEAGGVLGFFTRGMMVPEFEAAAFGLEAGELVTEPVRTQFGYHIIETIERRLPEGEEFETQKESIRAGLQQQRGQQEVQEWLESLRTAAKIDVKDPLLNAVRLVADGAYTEAIEYYEKALNQNQNDGYINYSMGNVYQFLGDMDKAIEQFQMATNKQPYDPELHFVLGQALLTEERNDEAVESLMTAAEWAPNDYMMLFQVQSILDSLERTEESAKVQELIDDFMLRYEQQLQLQQQQQLQQQESAGSAQSTSDLMSQLDAAAQEAQERLSAEGEAASEATE